MSASVTQPAAPLVSTATGSDRFRQFAIIVVTVLTLIVNVMATTLPINGIETGDISDKFPVLFTPAGYVFSIWSVIYLGLIAYTVFQAIPAQATNPRLRAIGWLYVVSGLANSLWILLWHYFQFGWSVVVMLVLLSSLALIYTRLWPMRQQVSRGEWWTTNLTFSIYLGWITVATVANVTIFLYQAGWNGWGIAPEVWTVVMLAVAAVLGVYFGFVRADVAYVLVLAWSFAGIYVKQNPATPLVAWTAAGLAVLMVVMAVVAFLRNRRVKNI